MGYTKAMKKAVSWAGKPVSANTAIYLGAAIIIVLIFGTGYVAVQQSLRQGANDPQIQLAEDAANKLNRGATASSVVGSEKVSVSSSLAPFIIVYNSQGNEIASSAELDGQTPDLPKGVLHNTTPTHHDIVTWQPDSGVRIAAVTASYNDGYVLAGRSLREVEKRESDLTAAVGLGLGLSLVVLGGVYLVQISRK
jgi:hypothetical protein